jgi:single-strand DNA-binding protein
MSSYNKVILMGNLTRDPELRYTQGNMAICKFGLAVNRRFKDSSSGEWREEPTFVDVTMFGKRGEAFSKYHSKGKPAFVEGELRFDTWEDKQDGQKRSKLYVVAESFEFVGGGRESGGGGGGGYGGESSGGQSSGGGQGGYSRQPQGGGYGDPQPDYLEVDDTPF